MKQNVTLELVLKLAKQLTPVEQVRLVEQMTPNKRIVGYDIPTIPIPDEQQRLTLKKTGEAVDQMLTEHSITEDELIQEFRELREGHRS